ncbi:MAG: hypothetical protein QOJ41_2670 [Acidobacteriaceae bacterium]|jgi:uncharacterized membrane protein YphA (DoxX/SURF4 family)|nr:hypothetical protein [Acidobacteriaceae bacterium]
MSDFAENSHYVHLLVATRMTSPVTLRVSALQRLFSTFPGSWPGVALLLLRTIVGFTAISQGLLYVPRGGRWTAGTLISGLLLEITGASLLVGFLTPIVSVLAGFACVASTIPLVPSPVGNLFDGRLVSLEMIVMAAAVALLGPGAFSLDARLFGRREILIPPPSREPKS